MRYDIDDAKLAVLYEPNCIYNCEGDMTLVLAKKYSGGIIMASDGRMILAPKGKIADVDDKFEKIFPLTPYSVIGISGKDLDPEAVKHFGNSIKETVMKMLKAPYSIQDCASDVHCILKKTKETLGFQPNVLIAGYGCDAEGCASTSGFVMINETLGLSYDMRPIPARTAFASTTTLDAARAKRRADDLSISMDIAYDKSLTVESLYKIINEVSKTDKSVGGQVYYWDITDGAEPLRGEAVWGEVGQKITIGEEYPRH